MDVGRLQQWQSTPKKYVSASAQDTKPLGLQITGFAGSAGKYKSSWSQMQVNMQQLFNVVHVVLICIVQNAYVCIVCTPACTCIAVRST